MSSGIEREETRKVATRCAVSSPAHTPSQALTATQNAGFKLLRHPLYLTDLDPTDFCLLQNWKKIHGKTEYYWRQWCYLHRKWLAGGPSSRILLQWHTGFGESLDQVHFCRRGLCWKVTKYHTHILLLTISGYELFERPSYVSRPWRWRPSMTTHVTRGRWGNVGRQYRHVCRGLNGLNR